MKKLLEDKKWKVVKLDGYIKIETGKREKGGGMIEGEVASLGGEHIGRDGNIIWEDMKFINLDFYNYLNKGKVGEGDILLVKDGATTGKVALAKNLRYSKIAVNEHVFILRTKEDLDKEFLFYFLHSKRGQLQIKKNFHGMIGGIKKEDVGGIEIPLPSLEEQKRIAEILSTIDKKLDFQKLRKEKLEKVKIGLMNELLPGKKRVNVERVLKIGDKNDREM